MNKGPEINWEALSPFIALTAAACVVLLAGLARSSFMRRNAVPVLTLVGMLFPVLIGSTAVIESVFAMPGIGRLAVEAALSRDYPTILTLNFLAAGVVLLGNLLVDVGYVALDPRTRLG